MTIYRGRVAILWRVLMAFFCISFLTNAQDRQRPFIWVEQGNRSKILEKIDSNSWAKDYYIDFKARTDKEVSTYNTSQQDFLRKIPLDWEGDREEGNFPTFQTITDFGNSRGRSVILEYLQIGIDCGVLYFLTQDEAYAQVATDILYTFVMGLDRLEPSQNVSNGGWIYPKDHLREAREIGAQLPIIYDFIAPYLKTGGQAYDVVSESQVPFPIESAQQVFLTY
ncbi:MAG: hypothetical protein WBG48_09750, partial [Pricia sp.]